MKRQPFASRLAVAVTIGCLSLAACQTPAEPRIVTKEVLVPVSKSCVPSTFRDPPATPDTDAAIKAAPGPGELLQLLAAGRILYRQWIAEARAVLAACR
ncbi:MAG: hypothetical protein JHD15_07045 [Phenylobacterium sp.]|uniref:hypothetical protein n=1 Tax=Phenylobacterium sp. TaxID=1871053 RepID=UPI001A184F16|nr:hypothetical protein [Phenylobacterium sp.]MBJ7410109.1 hypothetical protein [Phenylobacterium sp.]